MVNFKKQIIAAGIFILIAIVISSIYGYVAKSRELPQHGIMVERIAEYEI